MGYDVYCAFCGAIAGIPIFHDEIEDDTEDEYYDTKIADYKATEWMGDVRLLGENPECSSQSKVYVSGSARYDSNGDFQVEPGDDPNFSADGTQRLRVLDWHTDQPLTIPFHWSCYELFCKSVGPARIDHEVLYHTLKRFCKQDFSRVLSLDYGSVAECQEQYWWPRKGTEAFAIQPTTIPRLVEYYGRLPTEGDEIHQPDVLETRSISTERDCFTLLPPEILFQILSEMSISNVVHFRAASKVACNLALDQHFWKRRLKTDMPWVYDIPQLREDGSDALIDWSTVYKDILLASRATSETKIYGLVNRRRIWELSEQITEPYLEAISKKLLKSTPPVLVKAHATPLHRLVLPEPRGTESASISLVNDYTELYDAEPRIYIYWTDTGELSGFSICNKASPAGSDEHVMGVRKHFSSTDEIVVPMDDWPTGIVLTSREDSDRTKDAVRRRVVGLTILFAKQRPVTLSDVEGDRKLIYVDPKKVLVGFTGHCSSEGVVSKLALLQQPAAKLPWTDRLNDQNAANYSMQAMTYLWRSQLPPPEVRLTPYVKGYWSSNLQSDVSPMEALVFASCEEEAFDTTGLWADTQFGGFEIHYAIRSMRTIGPRHNVMKWLSIDGHGGERLSSLFISVGHIITGIRFVTNWGRQMVIGLPGHGVNNERRYSSSDLGGENAVLAGIYCHWSVRHAPESRLDALGVFSRTGRPNMAGEGVVGDLDPHGFFWEPSAPPAQLIESGRIWGQHEWRDRPASSRVLRMPGTGSSVCLLDCSRPLTDVRVTLCHGTARNHIPLSAVIFSYADGAEPPLCSESTVGPSRLTQPSDNFGTNGHPWCWCTWGSKRKLEMETKPHITQEIWHLNGAKLRRVRIWLHDGRLSAIQMVSVHGRESPIWGYADGEPSGAIGFSTGRSEDSSLESDPVTDAVAVKFFLNDNDRSTTYDDAVVVALQAMKLR